MPKNTEKQKFSMDVFSNSKTRQVITIAYMSATEIRTCLEFFISV